MMGGFRKENGDNQRTSFNQHPIFEFSSGKKVSFCEFGNIVNLENLHLSPNLFSEIQRINSEIGEHVMVVEKVHEIRIGEKYQAGLPNNIHNEGMTYDDDDDFTEGELVSYPNQKRDRDEIEEAENEFDLDLSLLLEDRIGSPKKKSCLQLPNSSLGSPMFDLSHNYPGETLFQTLGNLDAVFVYPFL